MDDPVEIAKQAIKEISSETNEFMEIIREKIIDLSKRNLRQPWLHLLGMLSLIHLREQLEMGLRLAESDQDWEFVEENKKALLLVMALEEIMLEDLSLYWGFTGAIENRGDVKGYIEKSFNEFISWLESSGLIAEENVGEKSSDSEPEGSDLGLENSA